MIHEAEQFDLLAGPVNAGSSQSHIFDGSRRDGDRGDATEDG